MQILSSQIHRLERANKQSLVCMNKHKNQHLNKGGRVFTCCDSKKQGGAPSTYNKLVSLFPQIVEIVVKDKGILGFFCFKKVVIIIDYLQMMC